MTDVETTKTDIGTTATDVKKSTTNIEKNHDKRWDNHDRRWSNHDQRWERHDWHRDNRQQRQNIRDSGNCDQQCRDNRHRQLWPNWTQPQLKRVNGRSRCFPSRQQHWLSAYHLARRSTATCILMQWNPQNVPYQRFPVLLWLHPGNDTVTTRFPSGPLWQQNQSCLCGLSL